MTLKCKGCGRDYTPDGISNLCRKCYEKMVPPEFRMFGRKKLGKTKKSLTN